MTGIRVLGGDVERGGEILTPDALEFVAGLHRAFAATRDDLLARRRDRRPLGFLDDTAHIREGDWRVAEAPEPLRDRRVEITGPTERKMTINALNSGAKVWLADLEDANTPHWHNVVAGQVNLYDAARGTVDYRSPEGKHYSLKDGDRPTVVVRPRGWHLPERHIEIDGRPAVGALVDFGLHFFHNAGLGRPYYYLPKLESHLEARLWNAVFTAAQATLGVPHGTIRATVLIETIPAAFEMEEILYELRDHASGLNAGRWDYLFSIIKYFRDQGRDFVLPDRNSVTMTAPFMRAYTELLVRTCHKRGAFAMGGMAAFIPNRRDPEVTQQALAKVRDDKNREANDGFDGSWVAHPDLVPVCREIFDARLGDRPNQLDVLREDVDVTADQLLDFKSAGGHATRAGVESAVDVGVRYLLSWLGGNGAAAIHNLMEDAATAEISRSQLWQWIHNDVVLDDGTPVTADLVREVLHDTRGRLDGEHLDLAVELFEQVALSDDFVDFLTLPAYERIA
ncbi:malate synthase [Saccharothrix tamanrassetensis]|uniref:Malate synthase n=1 Tax=Saccharothrix tamanrassetensis TaxID=1051531 RepID=A0A841CEY2_9PSEU|nr:malate synthase A [Saccharothrix tamanrassetensis]MBB5955513.1 malate synthase [Saccharothrix tamanrassetensis]